MRALIAIPHYFAPFSEACIHESLRPSARADRTRALATVILRLHELFGADHFTARHHVGAATPVPNPERMHLDIVVCTLGIAHLLDDLDVPPGLYHRQPTTGNPLFLGFAAHKVLAAHRGRYDWYCYLEDDIVIEDPLFFRKLTFFNRHFPTRLTPPALLQPSRYDSPVDAQPAHRLGAEKVYPDFSFSDAALRPGPKVRLSMFDRTFTLEPCHHPHAGSFFLNAEQMEHLAASPAFLNFQMHWVTWLDTAASLAIWKSFTVYKPAADSLSFLEVRHARPVMINQLRDLPDGNRTWRTLPDEPVLAEAS